MTLNSDQQSQEPAYDEQQRIVGVLQQLQAEQPEASLTLINIYKELPITHPASICEIRGHHVELSTSNLQLAAIAQCNEVFIRAPYLEKAVHGRLESIDIRRNLVRLWDFSSVELEAENRQTVRVRLHKPIGVILHCGTDRISGAVQDISLGGCCINTLVRVSIEQARELRVELKIIDKATGLPNCTRIPCTLVHCSGDAAPFRCAFRFQHDQQTEQLLAGLVNQRQLEILKELRDTL
ncbi:hypothetical protein GMLC_22350 [Geomonas limicola]|uniref:PilZ domain-containing protein n=1 Tax=Geomonas limicola TaxID=2740186 RepID=A0A6V8N7V2_9BACT|nr:PilZ domain-containing protein [Geomonas limicola]GFO68656.1 hypothetical protein GMLC_22350 [Geomonas limicola]